VIEVTWTALIKVEDEDVEEAGDIGVAAASQAVALLDDAVNRGDGATILAVRYDNGTLIGRYDIAHETPRRIS
jgi:hypothetical protein